MIKVFKTDLFRLFRTKAFYAFPVFIVIVMSLELMFTGIKKQEETASYTVETAVETAAYTEFGIRDMLGSVSDGLLLLFLGISAVMFATSESRNGFNKYAAGCVADRGICRYRSLQRGS